MNIKYLNLGKNGFTLIEVLVVVAIISVLSGVIAVNYSDSYKQSRDEKRQTDLRNLQSALDMYKNKYGRYPEACNSFDTWSGQTGTSFACSDGSNNYILGKNEAPDNIRPFSDFVPNLPTDPKLNGSNSGYVYRVNNEGSVYKLIAMNTVESESVGYNHPLKSCDIIPTNTGAYPGGADVNDINVGGWCAAVPSSVINSGINPKLRECATSADGGDGRFDKSYGVWGGFMKISTLGVSAACQSNTATVCATEARDTIKVICR